MSIRPFARVPAHVRPAIAFAAGFLTAATILCGGAALSAQEDLGVHVCVSDDGTMRLTTKAICSAGQQSVYLQKPQKRPVNVTPPPNAKPGSDACQSVVDQTRLSDLQERVSELENADRGGELSNHVVAPFEVTDRQGRRLFYVDKAGGIAVAQVYNTSGAMVAQMGAPDSGGQFSARSTDSALATYLGVFEQGAAAGLQVWEGGKTRLTIGKNLKSGGYDLRVLGAAGKPIAGIGQNSLGSGSAEVADAAGNVKVLLTVDKDLGRAAIFGPQGTEVAYLTQGAAAGGLLRILDAAGTAYMVEAGVTDGVGIVRAGPNGFKPGLGLLGVPGSYIMGK